MKTYITFDGFYNILQYNDFITTARKHKVEFTEFISIKAPYNWYLEIDEKHLPIFLNYKVLPIADKKWLLEKMIPLTPAEAYTLKRKPSSLPQDFQTFVSPNIFKDILTEPYCVLFKYKNKTDLRNISKEYGIKIYLLGRHREWNLAFTFNKYIRNFIYLSDILLEKKKASDFSTPGEFEYLLNYKKLVKVKLNNKTIEYPYYDDGEIIALNKLPQNSSFK